MILTATTGKSQCENQSAGPEYEAEDGDWEEPSSLPPCDGDWDEKARHRDREEDPELGIGHRLPPALIRSAGG